MWDYSVLAIISVAYSAYSCSFEVHVQHTVLEIQHPWVDYGLMDLKYVLRSHTDERFLLLYGKVFL